MTRRTTNQQTVLSLVLAAVLTPVIGVSETASESDLDQIENRRSKIQNPDRPATRITVPAAEPDTGAAVSVNAQPEASQEVSAETIYDNLAPHGEWTHLAGFGWCWQPHSSLGYDNYPWATLDYGSWNEFRTRGWCWIPSSQLRMSSYFQRVKGLDRNEGSPPNKPVAVNSGLNPELFRPRDPSAPVVVWVQPGMGCGAPVVFLPHRGAGYSGFGGGFYHGLSGGFYGGGSFNSLVRGSFYGGARGGFHSTANCGFGRFQGCGFQGGSRGGFHGGGRGHR